MHRRTTLFLAVLAVLAAGCSREQALGPDVELSFRRDEAPSGINPVVVAHNRIDVYWQDNSPNETGYELERATGTSGAFTVLASLPAGSTAYGDSGLTAQTQYCYRVRAFRRTGKNTTYSAFSTTACATTLPPPVPAAPSALAVKPAGSYVHLGWVDNSVNEVGFRFERSLDDGLTWIAVRTLSPNSTFAQDYGLSLEQSACYRVLAYNANGEAASNVACTAIPKSPTNLSATGAGTAIELTWIDNSGVEDGYEVYRTDGITAFRAVAQLSANSETYRDTEVINDITYRYEVIASKDGGNSYSSNQATAVVATLPPATPGDVHPSPWGSTAVSVTWSDNSGNEEGFRVERSTDGGASWVTVGTIWYAPYYADQFVDGGRTTEAAVCYRVFAYNRAGDSPASDLACTTPPAAPTNLAATPGPDGVFVTWNDNSAVEDGYYVLLLTDCSGQPEYWEWLTANATSYLDTSGYWCFGPTLGYYVVALKDGGWSDFSGPVYNGAAGSAPAAAAARPTPTFPRHPPVNP